jgi:hypothetical protein
MPCIGILGVQIYHTELPKDLFDMIYKNQNWLIGELDMNLFSHLELSYYNKFQEHRAYRNLELNIYTIMYKDVELYFYLEKSTCGRIYFIDKAVKSGGCIEYNPKYFNESFNEFLETLKNIGLGDRILDSGFFILEE